MKKFRVTVNGNTYEVDVEEVTGGEVAKTVPVATEPIKETQKPTAVSSAGAVKVPSPMPGKILDIKVAQGQNVNKGEVLAILEAMKMENEIVAPESGTVASIHVNKGQTVESGDTIISLN